MGTVPVGNGPTGVAVDRNGKIWVTNAGDATVVGIDPTLDTAGQVDLTVTLRLGSYPYNYSNMTGSTLKALPGSGTWRVSYDSGIKAGMDWRNTKLE